MRTEKEKQQLPMNVGPKKKEVRDNKEQIFFGTFLTPSKNLKETV